MNKPLNIFAGRSGMLGDTLAALPIARFFKKKYPDCQLIWPIGKKFSQAAPLYLNHPDISTVFILDGDEKPESQRDWDMVNSCQVQINCTPEHPDFIFPSQRTIYLESFLMAGLTLEDWNTLTPDEQRPKLYKWWKEESKAQKTISYWPQAGYGAENKRNANWDWCNTFIKRLLSQGYAVWQFGHPKDFTFDIWESDQFRTFKHLSFFEQIKLSLTTELTIGTDSGSALIIGAYEQPMISLLCGHWRQDQNPHALEVNNPNNFSFYDPRDASNISVDNVVSKVKDILK